MYKKSLVNNIPGHWASGTASSAAAA